MLRGYNAAAAGMIAQQRNQEMLTNNLSNANTPGYKADRASMRAFPNMVLQAMGTDHAQRYGTNEIGEISTGVYMQEATPNFRQGDIEETGNNTDLALLQGEMPEDEETGEQGALFYNVQNEDGDLRYTRNSNFTVDGAGFLTTGQGYYILDDAGDTINVGDEAFNVTRDGEILTEDGAPIAQLEVSHVPDPAQLVKEGDGLHNYEGDGDIVSAIGDDALPYQIQQGFIEGSNVDLQQTMTNMMQGFRNFEANQRALQMYDQSMERAVNDIGRIT
ncbi:flagellar hook-basal body protein [Texcoconibacillus texcoconensis]|uniref:Flagellar basal-body rod protein FlgG n=1 Tax=Texcoconibacillus texcoconensis TaxID=1095777 RepID=A0A840QTJ1_9BACI|nr:flagellar hook-basal body protein [Texcoconibacillus texcoconensis]MBB5174619.1 flagellar basal-body rod protein FlgG [Texcoconibacillus texcoconensis]